jgi:hypothetical protein
VLDARPPRAPRLLAALTLTLTLSASTAWAAPPPATPRPSASPSAPSALDPFAQCKIMGPEAGADRTLECPGGTAFATREGAQIGEPALIELMKSALSTGEAKPRWEEAPVTLGGVQRRGLRYTLGELVGVIVLVPSGREQVRGLGCEARELAWCWQILDALARRLPPPNLESPSAEAARRLAGRVVEVPPSCTEKAPGLVVCPRHSFSFVNHTREDPTTLAELAPSLRAGLAQIGNITEADRACTVEGGAASCRVYTVKRRDGGVVFVVAAFAEVRGQRVYVQCNSSEGLSPLPAACRPALALP